MSNIPVNDELEIIQSINLANAATADIVFGSNSSAILSNDIQDVIKSKVHLRVQQRSARKNITIIDSLAERYRKKVIQDLKLRLGCSGTEKNGELHFSGDQRKEIADYLLNQNIVYKNDIVVHGY